MDSDGTRSFGCSACGKKYKWKLSLAGKRVRCACGTALKIPEAEKPAAEDDLYGIAETELSLGEGIPAPIFAPHTARVATETARSSKAVSYQGPSKDAAASRFSFAGLTDPLRDLYVPTAMLIAGFLAFMIWIINEPHGAYPLSTVFLFLGAATLIKTAVIIALALLFAPAAGLSFGLLQTAILKFAAIFIFSDAALLWVEILLRSLGGISQNGKSVIWVWGIVLGCTTTVISITSYYLFSMDLEEVATFAIPAAVISKIIGYLLDYAVVAMLAAMAATAATARTRAVAASTPSPAGSSPAAAAVPAASAAAQPSPVAAAIPVDTTPVDVVPTPVDRMIAMRVGPGNPFVPEARLWEKKRRLTDQRTSGLIDQMYDAGAPHVYLEMQVRPKGTVGPPLIPAVVIVELPNQVGPRQICFDAAAAYSKQYSDDAAPATQPSTNQFLVVKLKH